MNLSELQEYKDIFLTIEDCRVNAKFINENSLSSKIVNAYKFIQYNKQNIRDYYSLIGYELVCSTGYCYFTPERYDVVPTKYALDFVDYIDIHNLLINISSEFTARNDFIFNISTLESRINNDIDLKTIVEKMTFIKKRETYREFCKALLEKLKNDGFVESFNNKEGEYKLLKSYKHIEDTIEGIREYE